MSEEFDEFADEEGLPLSCYLLEFSIAPGGARQGDVHVGAGLAALRESMEERWMGDDIDGHLIVWYGALLHLWVAQEGRIVEGFDLHPYLRTGDERCDRTLARLLEIRHRRGDRWEAAKTVLGGDRFETVAVLPALTRVLDLQDRLETDPGDTEARAALDLLLTEPPAADEEMRVSALHLDWAAIGRALPPLRDPLLTDGFVAVRWADAALRHPASYLHSLGDPASYDEVLHLGLNDLENGDDY